jgi:hypothetical protein
MKPRNRHVTHENRSNGPKVVETDARSPMLPMYSAAELAVRDPRRLSCVYEAACVDVVAKTSPNALAAECPEGCALQRKPDPNVRAYHASMSGRTNGVETRSEHKSHDSDSQRRSYAHRVHSRS